jgi:hypothetical protein
MTSGAAGAVVGDGGSAAAAVFVDCDAGGCDGSDDFELSDPHPATEIATSTASRTLPMNCPQCAVCPDRLGVSHIVTL